MLRIRLSRRGKKKDPHYRVVVAERSSPRDGRFVEIVGHYSPARTPKSLKLDLERIDFWVNQGAQPSSRVKNLIERAKLDPAEPVETEEPTKAPAKKEKAEAASVESADSGEDTSAEVSAKGEETKEPEAPAEKAAKESKKEKKGDEAAQAEEPESKE